MKIYTKTGDKGKTSIIGEKGVFKHDIRIDAYGTVDELNSYLGLVRSFPEVIDSSYGLFIIEIQKKLFQLGSYLAQADYDKISNSNLIITNNDISIIEKEIDKMTKDLPVLKSFVLNGGDILSSHVQISRTICRRAERKLTFVKEKYNIKPIWIVYLNRLSDFLFVLGRFFLKKNGKPEFYWKGS
ncbi:MAG: ATP:cob(I)alamin adenosyltransferase [Flavobacteriales bacterium]|nr:ATP:cob(I)alamin adenosyltransferase [Flavobacteriales bacterium]|tara:strand:- start:184 stop:738 length:555 start_codon:yes stop_codon:yes gene_type:complete